MHPTDPTSRLRLIDTTMLWSSTSGGVRRYLDVKHDWLARQPGVAHELVIPGPHGGPPRDEHGHVRFAAPPLPRSDGYRFPVRRAGIVRALVDRRPDLIEVGDPYVTAWAALDAARQLDVPCVAYCHSDLEAMARSAGGRALGALAERAAGAYMRRLYDRFDAVFAGSRYMATRLRRLGVERVELQPLGVDTARFHPERACASWRRELGIADDARVLLYTGRFAPEKHLDTLAAAVDRLGAPYLLLLVGAGPATPSGSRVRCIPFMADATRLATALASADAFVHAGDQETFGLSALEALACGTPVVARACAGMAELVDVAVGQPVHAGTPAAFAEAIAALFERDLAPVRRAARARAESLAWDRALRGLLGHYRRLIAARGAQVPRAELARESSR